MPTATVISYRLDGPDGVSVEAGKWAGALRQLGYRVRTVAGEGTADTVIPGLAIEAGDSRDREIATALDAAFAGSDLVIVENLCSLPLNPQAGSAVARALAGRPAVLRHHDLPWQRERFAGWPPPPDDPCWIHVTINRRSATELAAHGIEAHPVYNSFDTDEARGDRDGTRSRLGITPTTPLVLQPTRAIARKNIPAALGLAEALDAVFWILGPAEEGYGPELARLLAGARVPTRHGPLEPGVATGRQAVVDAYAAADVVAFLSSWEGFGNPVIESAVHRRPLVVGAYPVAAELAAFGFRWFAPHDEGLLRTWLRQPELGLLDHNEAIARRHFSLSSLPQRLAAVLAGLPPSAQP